MLCEDAPLHKPTHPHPSQEEGKCSSAPVEFPSSEGSGVGSWSQCMRKKRKEALHEAQSAAGILPADQSEKSTAGKMPAAPWRCRVTCSRFMAPMRGNKVVEALCSGGKTGASALLLAVVLLVSLAAFGSDPVPSAGPASRSATNNSPEMLNVLPQLPMPKFESWPVPPPRPTPTNVVSPGAEAAGKAALAKAAGEKRLFGFRAKNTELKEALAIFADANNLNIVPDLDVTGEVTLDVHDLPLEKMMQAMLEANDLVWSEDGGLIRVRAVESRNFVVDYLRLIRTGQGSSAVTLSSSGISSGGGQGGGSGGGSGGVGPVALALAGVALAGVAVRAAAASAVRPAPR